MTPEQLAAINAVATILSTLGTLPVGTLISLAVLGPWIAMVVVSVTQARRFEAVTQMYKDNVVLVQQYDTLVQQYVKVTENQHSTIVYNTEIMTEVKDAAENNLFCPIVRKGGKPKDICTP